MKPIELAQKREKLCQNSPDCPKCGEQHQIQLKHWIYQVEWKCRICKHKWGQDVL